MFLASAFLATTAASSSPRLTDQASAAKSKLDTLKDEADANYLAKPHDITPLGLRSHWQAKIPHAGTAPLAGMSLDGTEIFTWDHFGVVTRVKPDTGGVLWQGSTQSTLDKIYGVNISPAGTTPAAIALTDAATVAFEDGSGALLAQQSLRRVPATAGATNGKYVVFGDSEGRVIWLKLVESNIAKVSTQRDAPGEYSTNDDRSLRRTVECLEEMGAMSLGKIVIPPVVVPGVGVLTVSTGGEVCLFHATNAKPIWKYKSNAPFVSKPSVLNGIAYVSGKDQYLHAIDLKTGQSNWNWFTQSPLVNPPLAAGDLVALQVPEEGLVAFSTTPGDKVSGLVQWKSKAAGNAITRINDGFILWDETSRTMSLVETKAGGITATATFPNAVWVASTAPVDGTILLLSSDGRLQQLRPIEATKSAAPAVPVDTKPAAGKDATLKAEAAASAGTP